MTQEEFNQMLAIGLGQIGIGDAGANVENPDEVETVTTLENTTTMPMAKRSGGAVVGYVQISIQNLLTQMASQVDPSAVLAASNVIDGAQYNSTYNRIELTHRGTVVATIDATQIFNAVNYYTKTQADNLLDDKLDEITQQQFNAIFD